MAELRQGAPKLYVHELGEPGSQSISNLGADELVMSKKMVSGPVKASDCQWVFLNHSSG